MKTTRMFSRASLVGALLVAAGAIVLAPASVALAQEPVREVRAPVAPELGIDEIDATLRRELGLFPEVEGFGVARLYEVSTDGWVLELTFREDRRTVRERRPLTEAGLRELRDRIAAGLAARGLTRAVTSEGRGGLVLAQTALGLGFYGWALPVVFDIESDRGAVATYLLTAGASFLVPYRITRSITVTQAHRDAVVWGGTRGIVYGLLLGDALTLSDDDDFSGDPFEEDSDERVILGLGVATSVAGSVLGYQWLDPARHDQGDVALWSTGGDFSLAYGFGTATALGLYSDRTVCNRDLCETVGRDSKVAGHLTTMAVGLAGTYGARKWAERRDYTVGDARALLSFGVLGGQAILPLAWAAFEDDGEGERGVAASLVAGSAAGLWLGDRYLRGRSLTGGEGLLVQAGHVAGGVLAGGLTYLVDDGEGDELLYMATTAAGSVAGSLLTFRSLSGGGGGSDTAGGATAGAAGAAVTAAARPAGPTVEVNAAGLWTSWLARDARHRVRIPVLTVRH